MMKQKVLDYFELALNAQLNKVEGKRSLYQIEESDVKVRIVESKVLGSRGYTKSNKWGIEDVKNAFDLIIVVRPDGSWGFGFGKRVHKLTEADYQRWIRNKPNRDPKNWVRWIKDDYLDWDNDNLIEWENDMLEAGHLVPF